MNTWIDLRFRILLGHTLACLCTSLPIHAIASGSPKGSGSASTPAALYQSYCSVCHGEQGNGQSRARASLNPPPLDFTQAGLRATLTRERIIVGIREGRPNTAMVGWKTQLTDVQIASIADYVRDKFMEPDGKIPTAAQSTTVAPSARVSSSQVSAALKGDKVSGSRLYENNCVACHGKAGDGNGPRAYFISPKPRSFVTAESRMIFTRAILINSIAQGKRGTEMPSWDKVLTDQEIANIAEYVFQRFITADNAARPSANK
jgi:mono/diheme cytochrome c family protein